MVHWILQNKDEEDMQMNGIQNILYWHRNREEVV